MVRKCVDYRDLNKASPKDDFPLPHMIVGNISGHALFSSMGGSPFITKSEWPQKRREELSYHSLGHSLLQSHAVWSEKCWDHLSKGNDCTFYDMINKEMELMT